MRTGLGVTFVLIATTLSVSALADDPPDVDAILDAAMDQEGDERLRTLSDAMVPAALDVLADTITEAAADRAALALIAVAELGDGAPCDVVAAAAPHEDPSWRVAAANAAARCGDLAPLRQLLADPDPVLRLKAAVTLDVLEDTEAEASVVAIASDPEWDGHQAFVALAAGLLGRDEARDALDIMLLHGPTRLHAALALSRLGAEDVILDLVFALDDVADPLLRHAILDEVVAQLPPTGRDAVAAMAADDPSPRIADAAGRAARRWLHLRPRDGQITSSPPARVRPRPD